MNISSRFGFGLFAFVVGGLTLHSQTIWTDGAGGDPSWSNTDNWSTGTVPSAATNVQIGVQPSANLIGIDTGDTRIASLTYNNTLTAPIAIELAVGDTLQVNGAITNNSAFTHTFNIPVTAGANATWSGPLVFNNIVDVSTRIITLSNSLSFTGSDITFAISNASTYGRFIGSGIATVSGVTINIGGAYAATIGDTFDFTTGAFTGATLGTLPTLANGLTWNTSSFISSGILSVQAIPEPSTFAALFGLTALGFGALRRRPRAKLSV
jgi:hypothetical protein